MNINSWEMMIPISFFAKLVRVANELGAGNGKAAKFSNIVSASTSMIIGLFFCTMIMIFHGKLALLFTSSDVVIQEPILSGVAVGSGWQASVAYINLGCYYGMWSGMIGGTAVQTLILIIITVRCDWDMQVIPGLKLCYMYSLYITV
ncbi:hypothetical protein MKW92_030379 [Papaver armeniacum]|nr:hypothetical protein MKW92_030379 [Papaver armeniacum]